MGFYFFIAKFFNMIIEIFFSKTEKDEFKLVTIKSTEGAVEIIAKLRSGRYVDKQGKIFHASPVHTTCTGEFLI